MTTSMTNADLYKEIKLIGTAANKLQSRIHTCAMNCMAHAANPEIGDARPMMALFNALPKSQRRVSLLKWVEGFSPIFVSPDGDNCGLRVEGTDKLYRPFDLDGANANPFWEYTDESVILHGAGDYIGKAFAALAAFEKDVKEGVFRGDADTTRIILTKMCGVFGDADKLKELKASDKVLKIAA